MSEHASARDMESLIDTKTALWLAGLEDDKADGRLVRLRFVTTSFRSPGWEHDRVVWLAQLFRKSTDWVYERIIFTDDKSLVMGDILVEDSANNIERWLARNTDGVAIMFPRSSALGAVDKRAGCWRVVRETIEQEMSRWT